MTVPPAKLQILDAAFRLMRERGYHRTALGDVLRESRTGKGNFYHYFASKEALGRAILDRLGQDFARRTLEPIFGDARRSPLEQVDAFLDAIRASQRARQGVGGCPLGNLALELADSHEGFRRQLSGIFDGWRGCLAGALIRARDGGVLRADVEPVRLAAFVVASLEGAILLTKVTKDLEVLESCVEEIRRHVESFRAPLPVHEGVPT